MDVINTDQLGQCLSTLRNSYLLLKKHPKDSIEYEVSRNSLVKAFEMTLEQSGKLLQKKLTPYFPSKQAVDALRFKDIFRQAHKFSILNEEETERWLKYRDNRNTTAHNYGQTFAGETLSLMGDFLKDANHLKWIIDHDKPEAQTP